MPKRRKHRFYIDVTYNKALHMRKAAKGLQLKLDSMPISDNPVWFYHNSPYIDKVVVVEKVK